MSNKSIDSKIRNKDQGSINPNEDLLVVIADAESALTERIRQDAEEANRHIHDNHWNWH